MTNLISVDFTALGIECYVKLYDDHVEIKKPDARKGRTGLYILGSYAFSEIQSVFYRPSSSNLIANGLFQIMLKNSDMQIASVFTSSNMPNAMNFHKKHNAAFKQMTDYITSHM